MSLDLFFSKCSLTVINVLLYCYLSCHLITAMLSDDNTVISSLNALITNDPQILACVGFHTTRAVCIHRSELSDLSLLCRCRQVSKGTVNSWFL